MANQNSVPLVHNNVQGPRLETLIQDGYKQNPYHPKHPSMAYNLTAKGIIRERTAVLVEQRDYVQALEEDTERTKPTMAVPKSALSKLAEGEAFDIPRKPDNGFQIQGDKKPTKWNSEPKKYEGRRKNARVLDMNWKLDTYFVEKGAWIYMDKSNKEKVFDWHTFEEDHSGATF